MNYISLKSQLRATLACGLYLSSLLVPQSLRRDNRGKTRILVFHHLDQPARFRAIIARLKRHYNLISYSQYLAGQKVADKINLIIALDDGYRSWFTNGLPVFREFGVKPLLFINSDFVGLDEAAAHTYCRENIHTWPEASLSWDEVKALAAAGAEFGGHSLQHTNLRRTKDEQVLQHVIADDRSAIATQLGQSVRNFAYPFGLYNERAAAQVQQAGYTYGFSSDSAFLEESANPYLLKRTNIGLRPALMVQAVVEGWADTLTATMATLRGKKAPPCANT